MAGYSGASDQVKLALVLLITILLVHVVAFGAPYWTTRSQLAEMDRQGNVNMKRSGGHAGLWTACTEGECYERFNLWAPGWVHWCQALMTTSLVLLIVSTFLLSMYLWHRLYDRDKRLISIGLVFCAIASVFTLFTVLLWPVGQNLQTGEYLNWPYALACLSFLLSAAVTYLHLVELRSPDWNHKATHPPNRIYTATVTQPKDGSMPMLHSKSGSTLFPPSNMSRDFEV